VREREQEARKVVKSYLWWAAGVSMIPLVCMDMAAVAGVQLKMLADISKIYDVPFEKNSGKVALTSLGAFFVPHAAAFGTVASMFKAIPVVGTMVGSPAAAVFSWGYTWAVGNVFIQHFETGGTFLNFDAEKLKEYFQAQFEEGRTMGSRAEKQEEPAVSVTSADV